MPLKPFPLSPTLRLAAAVLSLLSWTGSAAEYFRHLTLDDGLSQPSVMAIAQDRLGRMWFGTREGVNMYDGVRVTPYRGWVRGAGGQEVWIGNEVSAICPDSAGNLYMLIDRDIVRHDLAGGSFGNFTSTGGVTAMGAWRGEVFCLSNDSLFSVSPAEPRRRFLFSVPPAKGGSHLWVDSRAFYISTRSGLHVFDRVSHRHEVLLAGQNVYSSFTSSDRTLWISLAEGGLYAMGPNDSGPRLASEPLVPDGPMGALQTRHAVEDSQGKIWYGSFTGLFCHDPRNGSTRRIEIPANAGGLTHSSVFGMLCDRKGNIWAGTYYGGVNYFSPEHELFGNFTYDGLAPSGLNHSFIIGMEIDRHGNLWFGTDGAGACCVDKDWTILRQLSTKGPSGLLLQNNIKALAYDAPTDRLFIGTHLGGLSVYALESGRLTNFSADPALRKVTGDVIHSLKISGRKLFIGSRTGCCVLDLDDPAAVPVKTKLSLNPFRMDFDRNGTMFCLVQGSGAVYKVEGADTPEPKVTVLPPARHREAVPSALACLPSGVLVATLGNGLFFHNGDTQSPRHINTGNSRLPSDYCYNVKTDRMGNACILTDRHVAVFDPEADEVRSVEFADFFPDSHLIDECTLLPLPDGQLLVGSTKGITRLKEGAVNRPSALDDSSVIFLSSLEVDNEPVFPQEGGIMEQSLPLAGTITLPHDRNNFTLHVGVSDYSTSSAFPEIEYRLEGADSRWLSSTDGTVRFHGLAPGSYTLRIRKAGETDGISIGVKVLAPWYGSWWAWTLYLLAGAVTGWFLVRKTVDAARLKLSLKKAAVEKDQIERLNQEKFVFFTNVSHEFQTPLTLITSHIDLLCGRYKRHAHLMDALGRIRHHTQQMSHLITQLLEFRKLQQNRQELRVGFHDAAESLRHNAAPFTEYAQSRDIDFSIDIPTAPATGFYDPALVDRVLVNLLSNAFKYTPDGGTITCSVRTAPDGRQVVFEVADTGKGISEKDLPFIFERFYNGNPDENKKFGLDYRSTGIGLAFAKSIVDRHHGRIDVASHEGSGTTFTVTLPATPAPFADDPNASPTLPAEDKPKEAALPPELSQTDYDSFTLEPDTDDPDQRDLILIVEDNRELRRNLAAFFSTYFRIQEAGDGLEGLEKIRSLTPDLVISDVMMPEMDGTQMCRTVKADAALCHIPVVLLTALSASESQIEGLNANADDYVTKPFEAPVLLARVDNLLRKRRMLHAQFGTKPVSEIDLSVVNPLDRTLLKRTSDYIADHLDDSELDIQSLCREAGMSRSLFFAKFKALTGMTPNNFLLDFRLRHASELLKSRPDLTVTEISEMAGFGTPAYFSRCFRKHRGVSPQAFRKESERSEV